MYTPHPSEKEGTNVQVRHPQTSSCLRSQVLLDKIWSNGKKRESLILEILVSSQSIVSQSSQPRFFYIKK